MHRVAPLAIIALALLLQVTPGWAGPPNPTGSDAQGNTAGGTDALLNVTIEGHFNTAFGFRALRRNTSGDDNTATGENPLSSNSTGRSNTASGSQALSLNTTGFRNTATGADALQFNATGSFNTASGNRALGSNTTGFFNTASGAATLLSNTTGNGNTAAGSGALGNNQTGDSNTAVGFRAGSGLETGSNNIYLGHPGKAVESTTMRLGRDQTRAFIAGANSPVNGTPVVITASGRLGTPLSSARYKDDIEPLATRSEGVHRLRPVTFVYRHDEERIRQYGLVAEEVAAVYPELVTTTEAGEVQGVRYHELIPLLLNELQKQQQLLLSQQRDLAELRARIEIIHTGNTEPKHASNE